MKEIITSMPCRIYFATVLFWFLICLIMFLIGRKNIHNVDNYIQTLLPEGFQEPDDDFKYIFKILITSFIPIVRFDLLGHLFVLKDITMEDIEDMRKIYNLDQEIKDLAKDV